MHEKTTIEGGQQEDSEEKIDKVFEFEESFRRNHGNHIIMQRPISNVSSISGRSNSRSNGHYYIQNCKGTS